MYSVGPYRYTVTDARRTFELVDAWWSLLVDGLDDSDLGDLDTSIRDAVASVGPLRDDAIAAEPTDEIEAALSTVLASLCTAAARLRSDGRLATAGTGTVAALNSSKGGVPKRAIEEAVVGFDGVGGDMQRTRLHHGRAWQALCLWSKEVVDAFAADGHPLLPGGAGENVLVSGLRWRDVRPGVRLRIGDVLCETSAYAVPCTKTAFNFLDRDFEIIHHSRGPVSRIYATVVEPGIVRTGDTVTFEP